MTWIMTVSLRSEEDLIKDKWNLILPDLQDSASKVVKDAQGLKLEMNALSAQVLIDAVNQYRQPLLSDQSLKSSLYDTNGGKKYV